MKLITLIFNLVKTEPQFNIRANKNIRSNDSDCKVVRGE